MGRPGKLGGGRSFGTIADLLIRPKVRSRGSEYKSGLLKQSAQTAMKVSLGIVEPCIWAQAMDEKANIVPSPTEVIQAFVSAQMRPISHP